MASTVTLEANVASDPFRHRGSFLRHVSAGERELDSVKMDHCYAKTWSFHPGASNALPAKMLFVSKTLRMSKTSRPYSPESSSANVVVDEEEESPAAPVHYDMVRARQVMNECDRHVSFLRTDPNDERTDEDWEERLDRTGWTPSQSKLFNKILKNLQADRLSKLACEGTANEPVMRRIYADKCAKMVRRTLGAVGWEPDLMQWLHKTLVQNLSNSLLGSYLNVLQTLRSKVPSLIDKMTASSRATSTSREALNLLLKRPWDPAMGLLSQHKPSKLPKSPVLLMAPHSPFQQALSNSRRTRFWISQLSGMGKVVQVTSTISGDMDALSCLDSMTTAVKEKICEVRTQNPSRPIILIGWSIGALIATQVCLDDAVAGVICLGFPSRGLNGYRGDIDEPLLDCKTPCLFVIGQESSVCNQDDIEGIRERMKVITGMVTVGGADEQLRMSKKKKKMEGVTQSMVDRCIIDEIGEFLYKVLEPEPVIQSATTHLEMSAKKRSKDKERKEEKQRRKAQRDLYSGLKATETMPVVPKRSRPSFSEVSIGDFYSGRKVADAPPRVPRRGTPAFTEDVEYLPSTPKQRKLSSPKTTMSNDQDIVYPSYKIVAPHRSDSGKSTITPIPRPRKVFEPHRPSVPQEANLKRIPMQNTLLLEGKAQKPRELPSTSMPAVAGQTSFLTPVSRVAEPKRVSEELPTLPKVPEPKSVTKQPMGHRAMPTLSPVMYKTTLCAPLAKTETGPGMSRPSSPRVPGLSTSASSLTKPRSPRSPKPSSVQKPIAPPSMTSASKPSAVRMTSKTDALILPVAASSAATTVPAVPATSQPEVKPTASSSIAPVSRQSEPPKIPPAPLLSAPPPSAPLPSASSKEQDNSFSAQYARFLAQLSERDKGRYTPKQTSAEKDDPSSATPKAPAKRKLTPSPNTIKKKQMRLVSLPIITQEPKMSSTAGTPMASMGADDSNKASSVVKKVSGILSGKGAINFEKLKVAMNLVVPKLGGSLGEAGQSLLKTTGSIAPASSSQVFTLQQFGSLSRVTPSTSNLLSGLNFDIQQNKMREAKGGIGGILGGILDKGVGQPNQHAFIQALNSTKGQQIRQPRRLSGPKSPKRGESKSTVQTITPLSSVKCHGSILGQPKSVRATLAPSLGHAPPVGSSKPSKSPLLPGGEVSVQTIQKLQFHDFPLTTVSLKPARGSSVYTQAKILSDVQQGTPLTLNILGDGGTRQIGLGTVSATLKANTLLHTLSKPVVTADVPEGEAPNISKGNADKNTVLNMPQTNISKGNADKNTVINMPQTNISKGNADKNTVINMPQTNLTVERTTPAAAPEVTQPSPLVVREGNTGISDISEVAKPGPSTHEEVQSNEESLSSSNLKKAASGVVTPAKSALSTKYVESRSAAGSTDDTKPPGQTLSGGADIKSTSRKPEPAKPQSASVMVPDGNTSCDAKSSGEATASSETDTSTEGVTSFGANTTPNAESVSGSKSADGAESSLKVSAPKSGAVSGSRSCSGTTSAPGLSVTEAQSIAEEKSAPAGKSIPVDPKCVSISKSVPSSKFTPAPKTDPSDDESTPLSELIPLSKPAPLAKSTPPAKPTPSDKSTTGSTTTPVAMSMCIPLSKSISPSKCIPVSTSTLIGKSTPLVKCTPASKPTTTTSTLIGKSTPLVKCTPASKPTTTTSTLIGKSTPLVKCTPASKPTTTTSTLIGKSTPLVKCTPASKPTTTTSTLIGKSTPLVKSISVAKSTPASKPTTIVARSTSDDVQATSGADSSSTGAKPSSGVKSNPRTRSNSGAKSPGVSSDPSSKGSSASRGSAAKSGKDEKSKGGWRKLTGARSKRKSTEKRQDDDMIVPNDTQLPTLARVTSTRTRKVRAPRQLSDYTELI